jgi:hypothetical protein
MINLSVNSEGPPTATPSVTLRRAQGARFVAYVWATEGDSTFWSWGDSTGRSDGVRLAPLCAAKPLVAT